MAKYRKKPVAVEATRWFKNGDHPLDESYLIMGKPADNKFLSEGKVVRRYRRHDERAGHKCKKCGKTMHEHGWIDNPVCSHAVCPGDWVITDARGEVYPCKPDVFEMTYEPIEEE